MGAFDWFIFYTVFLDAPAALALRLSASWLKAVPAALCSFSELGSGAQCGGAARGQALQGSLNGCIWGPSDCPGGIIGRLSEKIAYSHLLRHVPSYLLFFKYATH